VVLSAPLLVVPRLVLVDGQSQVISVPAEIGRSLVGIVDAVVPTRERSAVAAKTPSRSKPASARGTHVAPAVPNPASRGRGVSGSRRLVSVVTNGCTRCRVTQNSATGAIRATTLGGSHEASGGSAFARLDFGGPSGAGGAVSIHDRVSLDRGQVPQSNLSVLQVTDVQNRVAYRLQVDRLTRLLRFVSPPGGLNGAGLDLPTGARVPNDGVRALTVDVVAQAGRSLTVRVDGRTVIRRTALTGGDAVRQRYVAVGILNTPTYADTVSITHDAVQVAVASPTGVDQSGVSAAALSLAPSVAPVAPSNVGTPSIAGTAMTGEVLSADLGSWSGADSVRVRWGRCGSDGSSCQPIPDATGTSYVPGADDAGATLRIVVTASNAGGSSIATSSLTQIVASAKPVVVTAPAIVGDPLQGQTLTVAPGTWTWRNGSFAYAWQRCDAAGANCAPIAGQSAATLALGAADVGSTIRLVVTVPGLNGSTTVTAPATAAVRLAPPVDLVAPALTGDAIVGAVLTATAGTWGDPAPSYAYSWQRCAADGSCATIAGAEGNTYTVTLADLGSTLRAGVAASNAAGVVSALSNATAIVIGPPVNSVLPVISGVAVVGSTLVVDSGTWSDPASSFVVVWERCGAAGSCVAIAGASGGSYVVSGDDVGSSVVAVVTASDAGGSASATSAATAPVVAAAPPVPPVPPVNSVLPVISGVAVVGSTLVVDSGTWSDPASSFVVVWERCGAAGSCVAIAGASGGSYVVSGDDVGSSVVAVVTASDAGGSASATSAATAPVVAAAPPAAPVPPVNSVLPVISGVAVVGSTLVVDSGTWSDPASSFVVVWERCGAAGSCVAIAGASGGSYVVSGDDVGSSVVAVVTASDAGGSASATSAATAPIAALPRDG
jgi:hypothetical protein